MAASTRRDLFISINGSIDGLSNAAKAGKSVLLDMKGAAVATVEQIEQQLQKMGTGSASGLIETERNFKATFDRIRANARDVLASDGSGGALKIIDAAGAQQAAQAATARAAALRTVADAAQRAAAAENGENGALNTFAASSAAATVEAERYAAAMNEQAGVLTRVAGQTGVVEQGGKRIAVSSGQQKAAMQQLSFQISDVATQYAAGTSATIIFAQQSGQVIQALQLMIGEGQGFVATLGKFAPFIGAALVVLTPFVAKLIENSNALQEGVDKLKKEAVQTEQTRLATEAYTRTIEGEIAATKKLNDELDRSIRTQRQLQQNKLRDAQQNVSSLQTSRPGVATEIQLQEQAVSKLQSIPLSSDPNGASAKALADAKERLDQLRQQLRDIDTAIAAGLRGIREAQVPLIQNDVEAQLDKNAAAARRYEIALGNLNQRLAIGAGRKEVRDFYQPDGTFKKQEVGGISAGEYQKQLAIIAAQRKADEKAARDAERRGNNSQTGREVTPSEAAGIARAAGLQVNSSSRTYEEQKRLYDDWVAKGKPADNPVAMPGTSAHEGAKGRWALDIQFGPGVTPELLRKVFADQGVTLSKVFKERGHYHVEGSRSQADGAASAADAAAQKEAERRAAFERDLGEQQSKALELGRQLIGASDEQLKAKLATIDAEQATRVVALDNLVTTGKLKGAEADQLKAVAARIADAKKSIATNKDIDDTRRKILSADRDEYDDKSALLDLQGQLATTNKERLRIARELLDLELKQRRAAAEAKIASRDPDEATAGKRELARVDAEEPGRRAALAKQYASPLARFRDELKAATDDMDEALEGVAVNGLQNLEDGLLGVINGTETVAGAFKKMAASIIADLLRIQLQKAIVSGLTSIFGASNSSILSGLGAAAKGHANGTIPAFADGIIRGPGTGTSDSIPGWMAGVGPVFVSNGEGIMNARAVRNYGPMLKAMNAGQVARFASGIVPTSYPSVPTSGMMRAGAVGQSGPIVITLRVTKGEAFAAEVVGVSGPHTVQILQEAAPTIVQAASDHTVDRLNRPRL